MLSLLLPNLASKGEYQTPLPPSEKAFSQVILNTRRPKWATLSDLSQVEKTALPAPDAVLKGMGTSEHHRVITLQ